MTKREVLFNCIDELKEIYNTNKSFTVTANYFCEKYGYEYTDPWRRAVSHILNDLVLEKDTKHSAKILVFDIETAPIMAYVWGGWKQNPAANTQMIIKDWFILTWSAKWLFNDKVMTGKLTSNEAIKQDDSRIVKELWELLEEADVVIAHNALKFDIKKVNTRFLKAGLNPPMPYQVIDTLVHARRQFSLTSNKLDYIAKELNLEGKKSHEGFSLWDKCYKGDPKALDDMEAYNIQDILVLEEVYLKLRPWIKPHPNIGLFVEDNVQCCGSCGSTNLSFSGDYHTYANTYSAFRCGNCGSTGRSRKALTNIKSNSNLTIPLPK